MKVLHILVLSYGTFTLLSLIVLVRRTVSYGSSLQSIIPFSGSISTVKRSLLFSYYFSEMYFSLNICPSESSVHYLNNICNHPICNDLTLYLYRDSSFPIPSASKSYTTIKAINYLITILPSFFYSI